MRHKLFLSLLLLFTIPAYCLAVFQEKQRVYITVHTPGTLSSLVKSNKNRITNLVLSGTLNGTDLLCLREMAGTDFHGHSTNGKLSRLDLSTTSFTNGGKPYIYYQQKAHSIEPGSAHSVPAFAFRGCRLTEVVMKHTSILETGAFEHSPLLKRVVLPDNAAIKEWAFNQCPMLEEVVFPSYTECIYSNAFRANNRLKKIEMNDVNYIAANGFLKDQPTLESFTIKGFLIHIDGWNTIENCTSLKTIDFVGPVLTTGGPYLATNCPKLQHITFHSPVGIFGLGEEKGCPAFRGYTMKSLVFYSEPSQWAKALPEEKLVKDNRYVPALKSFMNIIDEGFKRKSDMYGIGAITAFVYREAKRQAEAGHVQKSYAYLSKAADYGYADYRQIKEDEAVWNKVKTDSRFKECINTIRMRGDYPFCLQESAPYKKDNRTLPRFTYVAPSDTLLTKIRMYFNLDKIAGNGDELSRMKNLMYWVHDHIRHDGSSSWPNCRYNAIDLYQITQKENRGLNCRFMAMVLNDFYLAMGYPSRFVTCMPKAYETDNDCHVTNMVWSRILNKWIWMDPTFAAYVCDENGIPLNQREVRERIRKGLPLSLNDEANWNHQIKQTKEDYIYRYMAKNLYWFTAHIDNHPESEFYGPRGERQMVLVPEGFNCPYNPNDVTSDDDYFWQAPGMESCKEYK